MKLLEKLKTKVNTPDNDSYANFIPYSIHFDHNTIITKNGELIQTIKIESVGQDLLKEDIDLRKEIRDTISQNINSNQFALWFHTLRRKANLDPPAQFTAIFPKDTHESWCEKNYWRDKFINELYITILHEGEPFKNKKRLWNYVSIKSLQKHHLQKLEQAKNKLYEVVDKILKKLHNYGAKRLTVQFDRKGSRSELLEFINKITHLNDKRIDLPVADLSKHLATGKMFFSDQTFQIVDEKKKFFGAMFSIKEYRDFSQKLLDSFLKAPHEFIITQTINFTNAKQAKNTFKQFNYILEVSKDEWLREKSGLKDIIESDKGNANDYGSSQLTIMIVSENRETLEQEIKKSIEKLNKLGLVVIREDLNMEQCFWSQLPGNFNFISRNAYINTRSVAGFNSLHSAPKGNLNNPWGSAVTLFRLEDSTSYFFNFHDKNLLAHTLICGPKKSGKTTLMNFLLSESFKYNPKVFFIDQYKSSKLTIKALSGTHYSINLNQLDNINFNPLSLEDSQDNRNFLQEWLSYMIHYPNIEITPNQKQQINKAIEKIYSQPKNKRQLKYAELFFDDKTILEKLVTWRQNGKYAQIFDNEIDNFDTAHQVLGYEIQSILEENNEQLLILLISYFLHRFIITLDGSPTLLMINDANEIFKSDIFTNKLAQMLDHLKEKNAIAIFMKETTDIRESSLNSVLPEKFSTLMFLPDKNAPQRYSETLKLTDVEIEKIRKMKSIYRHFMIKQDNKYVIAELNLDGMNHALAVLAGRTEYLKLMEESIAEKGDDPNKWLQTFYYKVTTLLEEQK